MSQKDIVEVLETAASEPGDRLAPGGGLLQPDLSKLSPEDLKLLQEVAQIIAEAS